MSKFKIIIKKLHSWIIRVKNGSCCNQRHGSPHLCLHHKFLLQGWSHFIEFRFSWQKTSTKCWQWRSLISKIMHLPQSSPTWHNLGQRCPFSHAFSHRFGQALRCSGSIAWQAFGQTCPQDSRASQRSSHPPSGTWRKSLPSLTCVTVFGWFWQNNLSESPIAFCRSKTAMIFFQMSEFSDKHWKLPTQYSPFLALDRATLTRLETLRKPISPLSLLRTNESIIMSLSSPKNDRIE